MFRIGLKLWSTNSHYYHEAAKLYDIGYFHYIELYVVPDSLETLFNTWKKLKISYIIHAPHSAHGLNLAEKESRTRNHSLIAESRKFADALGSEYIILHPGVGGNIEETVLSLITINDSRLLIENKPIVSIYDEKICIGNSPEEIKHILKTTNVGFCFDIGHAFCAAATRKIEPYDFLKAFLALNPRMYHLSDGNINNEFDKHKHINNGDYDLKSILYQLPRNSKITVETDKDYDDSLIDFIEDVKNLKELIKGR